MTNVQGSETILLVDDDESLRLTTARLLSQYGYRVLTAADGEAGWEILTDRGRNVDLVILDLVMPRMGGRALLRMAREMQDPPKFLVISGWAAPWGQRVAKQLGDVAFLGKPWSADELLGRIRSLLEA